MSRRDFKVVVIGAGVVGLSTAVCVQNQVPNARVTIVADKFLSDTLSSGAGGYFRPEATTSPGEDISTMVKWCRDSYEHFVALAKGPNAQASGVQLVSGYQLSSVSQENCQNSILEEITGTTRTVSQDELSRLFPEQFKFGTFYTTIVADQRYYLRYLTELFTRDGGSLINRTVDSLHEQFLSQFDIVVNCTGMGAKKLVGDFKMVPIRGQTIKVRAPWIKHFYFADGAYIIPSSDGLVTLGGIKEYGESSSVVSELQKASIWTRCTKLVPSLEKAEFCWDWVGLRPYRQPVRVEVDLRTVGQDIVHNYGHGGHGVTLSWGTAVHAANLVEDVLKRTSARSKL